VLATTLLLTFEVALAGDTRFVDGITLLSHEVVLFLRVLRVLGVPSSPTSRHAGSRLNFYHRCT
jgi:hypothetical protein